MTSKEKEIAAGVLTVIVIFGRYFMGAYADYQSGAWEAPGALTDVSRALLMTIFWAVGVQIVLLISFYVIEGIITQGKAKEGIVDERDRLNEMRSDSWFHWIAGFAFIGGLIHLSLGGTALEALHIMVIGWIASTMLSASVQFYFSRRGY